MDTEMLVYIAGVVVAAAVVIYPWFNLAIARRDKAAEEARRERAEGKQATAEAKLALICRRAPETNPMIGIAQRVVSGISVELSGSKMSFVSRDHSSLLCTGRDEIGLDVEAGRPIFLLVENFAAVAYDFSAKMPDEPRAILQAMVDPDHEGLCVICYPYSPHKRGLAQSIEISFLRADGVRDTHRYETRHGVRELRRIEPN